jgi:hypothetical protein
MPFFTPAEFLDAVVCTGCTWYYAAPTMHAGIVAEAAARRGLRVPVRYGQTGRLSSGGGGNNRGSHHVDSLSAAAGIVGVSLDLIPNRIRRAVSPTHYFLTCGLVILPYPFNP